MLQLEVMGFTPENIECADPRRVLRPDGPAAICPDRRTGGRQRGAGTRGSRDDQRTRPPARAAATAAPIRATSSPISASSGRATGCLLSRPTNACRACGWRIGYREILLSPKTYPREQVEFARKKAAGALMLIRAIESRRREPEPGNGLPADRAARLLRFRAGNICARSQSKTPAPDWASILQPFPARSRASTSRPPMPFCRCVSSSAAVPRARPGTA